MVGLWLACSAHRGSEAVDHRSGFVPVGTGRLACVTVLQPVLRWALLVAPLLDLAEVLGFLDGAWLCKEPSSPMESIKVKVRCRSCDNRVAWERCAWCCASPPCNSLRSSCSQCRPWLECLNGEAKKNPYSLRTTNGGWFVFYDPQRLELRAPKPRVQQLCPSYSTLNLPCEAAIFIQLASRSLQNMVL